MFLQIKSLNIKKIPKSNMAAHFKALRFRYSVNHNLRVIIIILHLKAKKIIFKNAFQSMFLMLNMFIMVYIDKVIDNLTCTHTVGMGLYVNISNLKLIRTLRYIQIQFSM